MMKRDFKLIATDIDGTLLNSKHQLSERNEQTLKQAMAQGIQVVLATGRPRSPHAIALIDKLGLQTAGIFLQGLVVHRPDGTIHTHHVFDPRLAEPIIALAEKEGYALMAYSNTRIIAGQRNRYTDRIIDFGEAEPEILGLLSEVLISTPFNKLVFFDEVERIPQLKEQIAGLIGDQLRVVQTLPESIEVVPKHISKGSALKIMLEELNISPENVIAFGDGENDVEMLQLAGMGVAMGNAMPPVKAVADYITLTNDEDGVAAAIEKFVL